MHRNKVELMGFLGKTPEIRETTSGTKVASFSLCTTERYKDKEGNKKERSEWHNIVAWGKHAELSANYLKKGDPAFIEGRITSRSWDDKDGNKKYITEIVMQDVQFLSNKSSNQPQTTEDDIPSVVDDDLPF